MYIFFVLDLFALMPPFETFLHVDKSDRLRHFFDVSKNYYDIVNMKLLWFIYY